MSQATVNGQHEVNNVKISVQEDLMQPEIRGLYRGMQTVLNNKEKVEGVIYPIKDPMTKIAENIQEAQDMVNHPSHYTFGKVECIEALEAMCSPEEFLAFLRLTIVQYLWRAGRKHNIQEDIEKAEFYINLLKKKAGEYVSSKVSNESAKNGQ